MVRPIRIRAFPKTVRSSERPPHLRRRSVLRHPSLPKVPSPKSRHRQAMKTEVLEEGQQPSLQASELRATRRDVAWMPKATESTGPTVPVRWRSQAARSGGRTRRTTDRRQHRSLGTGATTCRLSPMQIPISSNGRLMGQWLPHERALSFKVLRWQHLACHGTQ